MSRCPRLLAQGPVTLQSATRRTPWAASHVCKGRTRESLLVVDGSLDARKSFDAGKLEQEAVQVTPELNGAVPGLEGECGGPHIPEFSLEKPGRSQSVMQLAANASS